MERNYGEEIDSLKNELEEIKQLMCEFSHQKNPMEKSKEKAQKTGRIYKMNHMHPDPNIMAVLDKLENQCGVSGQTGAITYLGVFSSGERQSTWIRNEVNTDSLLSLIEDHTAEKVLSCIGSRDRLSILLSLLKKPMTVAQLIEECGYSSTGQVYHHLKPLLAADLITDDDAGEARGVYTVRSHRVQGIIMLLAGISDMVDPKYTQGSYDESTEP